MKYLRRSSLSTVNRISVLLAVLLLTGASQASTDLQAPATPDNVIVSGDSETQITIQWNASSTPGGISLAGYRVYRDGTLIATTTATSYSDNDLLTDASPMAYWPLNETNGVMAADLLGFHNGTINASVTAGVNGPQDPSFPGFETNNTAMQFNYTTGSYLTMPALNLNTNTVTITGWINPTGSQAGWAGIAFCRGGSTVAGLNFGPGSIPNELRYHWNNSRWERSTGLAVPTNQWSFVALVVTPTNATIYLGTNGVLNSSTDTVSLPNQAFDAPLLIGYEPTSGPRLFRGAIDEVAIYNLSLTPTQIQQLYNSALTVPSPATQHCYTITAFDILGNTSSRSAPACTATETEIDTAPSAPSGVMVSGDSETQITIQWNTSTILSGIELAGYNVYRDGSLIATTTATIYSDNNLTPATEYCYTIVASDILGNNSTPSAQVCASTQALFDLMSPAVPSGVMVFANGATQMAIYWNATVDVGGSGLAGYRVYRGGSWMATTEATSYADSGLSPSTEYCYTVVAYDDAGNSSSASAQACVTTMGTPMVINAPSNLAASAVATDRIDLSWTDNANNEAGYGIERYQSSIGTWIQIAIVGANTTSFTDVGLSPSTSYSYAVYAFNDPNYSPVSASASVKTLPAAVIVNAPSNLAASAVAADKINLSWQDNANNEDGFDIERYQPSTASWIQIATVGANTTSYSDVGLAPSTTYSYRVYAYNGSN